MQKLGAEIYDVWRGDTDEDDALIVRTNKGPTISLNSAADVDTLSAVCYGCMAVDASQRPTAADVNVEVRSWRNTTGLSNDGCALSQTSVNNTLSEQVAAVRARSQPTSATPRMDLRPEMLIRIRDVLRQHIDCLRALPASDSHRDASNVLQVLLAAALEQDCSGHVVINL
eukprot:TRINITY_DN8238_c0_g4_i2.p2 TRINITY_DN8238_c0_g4~~TRINITY_DN8238_c0_g4_i2.p2  ORF type:complete len:171 (+),score=14.07 TRINITY_DN8238_c0_g4_i2:1686-2198(+)